MDYSVAIHTLLFKFKTLKTELRKWKKAKKKGLVKAYIEGLYGNLSTVSYNLRSQTMAGLQSNKIYLNTFVA